MFLNQIHYLTDRLGQARGLRLVLLLLGPLAVFALLVLVLRG